MAKNPPEEHVAPPGGFCYPSATRAARKRFDFGTAIDVPRMVLHALVDVVDSGSEFPKTGGGGTGRM